MSLNTEQLMDTSLALPNDPELTDELKAELDRRIAEDDAAPDDVAPWEEVKAQALARIRR